MRVIIITNEEPHHKYFCYELSTRHNVVGIFHPIQKYSKINDIRKIRDSIQSYGLAYSAIRSLKNFIGWKTGVEFRRSEYSYFSDYISAYNEIDKSMIHHFEDINSCLSIDTIKDLNPDVVVCLGGAIYRRKLIESCNLMLNYHSGISPLYNGTSTTMFAFANGHPHLCGGTLMVMNSVIDGGNILAHFFPAIASNDTPATLFMKGIKGAVQLYDNFLCSLTTKKTFSKVPQDSSLFYYKGSDFTIYHSLKIKRHIKQALCSRFIRPEENIEYWSEKNDKDAGLFFKDTLNGLLKL